MYTERAKSQIPRLPLADLYIVCSKSETANLLTVAIKLVSFTQSAVILSLNLDDIAHFLCVTGNLSTEKTILFKFDVNSHFGQETFLTFSLLYSLGCSEQLETEKLGTLNQEAKPSHNQYVYKHEMRLVYGILLVHAFWQVFSNHQWYLSVSTELLLMSLLFA